MQTIACQCGNPINIDVKESTKYITGKCPVCNKTYQFSNLKEEEIEISTSLNEEKENENGNLP